MIKRENLKQAIDAIAEQDSEIGYSLAALLAAGAIDAPGATDSPSEAGGLHFWFRGEKVPVHRTGFFSRGVDALVQPMMIRYGEMAALQSPSPPAADLMRAAERVRVAGLDTAVRFAVAGALGRLRRCLPSAEGGLCESDLDGRIQRLAGILSAPPAKAIEEIAVHAIPGGTGPVHGCLTDGRKALFLPFPFTHAALLQAAERNLEFFDLRFLLRCLEKGHEDRLLGCLVQGRLAGLIYLDPDRGGVERRLEIVYIASARAEDDGAPKGVGTFLVAGAWLLGQLRHPPVRELVLDAEAGARAFYDAVGFRPRRICGYVLERPQDRLLAAIVGMVDHNPDLPSAVVETVAGLVRRRLTVLGRRRAVADRERRRILALARAAVTVQRCPAVATTAVATLLGLEQRIPEARELVGLATTQGRVRLRNAKAPEPVAVVHDLRFCRHLEGMFHLEGARRIQAVEAALHSPDLAGKWFFLPLRPAEAEELYRVHTPDHVDAVARTRGKPMTSLDPDTQATDLSYDTALLAAGSVVDLVDRVWDRAPAQGAAFVRPPGHHAEPDKAMGFCLFNNIALGARHLTERRGAKRILIVDMDAHHGNGTQTAFYDDDRVLFVSMHRFPGYPGTGNLSEIGSGPGTGFTVNVPLPGGLGDSDLIQVFEHLVLPLTRAWCPEVLLVSCGFDLHRYDRLGGMQASSRGYGQMAALLVQAARECCDGRIAFVLEGGYNVPAIEACARSVMQALCAPYGSAARPRSPRPSLHSLIKALAVQKKYWPTLAG